MRLEDMEMVVGKLNGDYSNYKEIKEAKLDRLERGRRAEHEFVFRSNIRTLKSGPNRGKLRVDGAVLVMFGKKNRQVVEAAIVRNGEKLRDTLDRLADRLRFVGE